MNARRVRAVELYLGGATTRQIGVDLGYTRAACVTGYGPAGCRCAPLGGDPTRPPHPSQRESDNGAPRCTPTHTGRCRPANDAES